jgi:hypothetical protein
MWHQQDVLSFRHPAYASLCVITTILTPCFKQILQTNNDRKVPKYLFRLAFSSVSVAVLVITVVFSMIKLVESTNRVFLEVFVLKSTI